MNTSPSNSLPPLAPPTKLPIRLRVRLGVWGGFDSSASLAPAVGVGAGAADATTSFLAEIRWGSWNPVNGMFRACRPLFGSAGGCSLKAVRVARRPAGLAFVRGASRAADGAGVAVAGGVAPAAAVVVAVFTPAEGVVALTASPAGIGGLIDRASAEIRGRLEAAGVVAGKVGFAGVAAALLMPAKVAVDPLPANEPKENPPGAAVVVEPKLKPPGVPAEPMVVAEGRVNAGGAPPPPVRPGVGAEAEVAGAPNEKPPTGAVAVAAALGAAGAPKENPPPVAGLAPNPPKLGVAGAFNKFEGVVAAAVVVAVVPEFVGVAPNPPKPVVVAPVVVGAKALLGANPLLPNAPPPPPAGAACPNANVPG